MKLMFDKVILHAQLDDVAHAEYLIGLEHLQRCTEGDRVYWSSTALANLAGISMRIDGNVVKINCSLHKMYYRAYHGRLDNTQLFTISQARHIVYELLASWRLDIRKVRVTYFEVGLNLPVDNDPLEYISLMCNVGGSREKELFNDANFEKNRQKTTEKGRAIKKVFKVYDKGFEVRNKGHDIPDNILRIETMYRRQNILLNDFLCETNIRRLLCIFYTDWTCVEFRRKISSSGGIKLSQIERAEKVLLHGKEKYLQMAREDYASGLLTAKQFRTIREFVQSWDDVKSKFMFVPDSRETEYMAKCEKVFNDAQK